MRRPTHLHQASHGRAVAKGQLQNPAVSCAPTEFLRNDQPSTGLAEINNVNQDRRGEASGIAETSLGRPPCAAPRR
jgi:hypothetical protein